MVSVKGIRRLRVLLVVAVAVVTGIGCARPGGDVRLTRTDNGQTFGQSFNQAYASRGEHGDWDVVLVHDGLAEAMTRQPGRAIPVADRVPVQHVVHLHVFWRPNRSVRADEPAASNAKIDWYVITPGARKGEDLLKYKGAGFVGVYGGPDRVAVTMRNVRLQREILRGRMSDPLEDARLNGQVGAVVDPRFVSNTLAELSRLESGESVQQQQQAGGGR